MSAPQKPSPDPFAIARIFIRQTKELVKLVESQLPPAEKISGFVPTPLQEQILMALDGAAMRGEAIAEALDVSKRAIYKKGGINELVDQGLIANHPRLGYYRPDAPPKGQNLPT